MFSLQCQQAAHPLHFHAPSLRAGISTTFSSIRMSFSIWLPWNTDQLGQCPHTTCQYCSSSFPRASPSPSSWIAPEKLLHQTHWKQPRCLRLIVFFFPAERNRLTHFWLPCLTHKEGSHPGQCPVGGPMSPVRAGRCDQRREVLQQEDQFPAATVHDAESHNSALLTEQTEKINSWWSQNRAQWPFSAFNMQSVGSSHKYIKMSIFWNPTRGRDRVARFRFSNAEKASDKI